MAPVPLASDANMARNGKKRKFSSITELLEYFSEAGRRGGKIGGKRRAESLTKEELSEIGKKGAAGRWGKKKKASTKVRTKKAAAKKKQLAALPADTP